MTNKPRTKSIPKADLGHKKRNDIKRHFYGFGVVGQINQFVRKNASDIKSAKNTFLGKLNLKF